MIVCERTRIKLPARRAETPTGSRLGSEGAMMACRTLLKRKTQLALLASACEQRVLARVGLRRRAASSGEAQLVALERDGVLMAWTGDQILQAEVPGQPVEVRFKHAGEHYAFFSNANGRVGRGSQRGKRGLLKLSLPLRLERGRCRACVRLTLKGLPAVTAEFTHAIDGRRQFPARLTDVADGGIGVVAQAADVSRLYTGDLFWVHVDLPGGAACPERIVRLTHLRPVGKRDELAMGWAFQPGDDGAQHERYVRRLEAFAARGKPSAKVEEAG